MNTELSQKEKNNNDQITQLFLYNLINFSCEYVIEANDQSYLVV